MMSRFTRRLAALACLLLLVAVPSLAWAPHGTDPTVAWPPQATEEGPVQVSVATPYLPFNWVETQSRRKVFAHYMPNFPISIDNKDGDQDYYAKQYLTTDGENGMHAAYGGYLRDRPLPRAHSNAPDWRQADLRTEIGQAKSVGIDGFAVDVIVPRAQSNTVDQILAAAAAVGNFTVLITADMTGPLVAMAPADFAADIAPYLVAPGSFHLEDGRPVLGSFAAEQQSPVWWANVLAILRDQYKLAVAFVPTFLDVPDILEQFAPFSYGFSMWGGRDPLAMSVENESHGYPLEIIRRTHRLGKIWMQPVAFQDARPHSGIFEEAANGLTNRLGWQLAEEHAQWVQMITWNDYAESTAMAPSVAHGWGILDMNAYDIFQFKFFRPPRVVRDALFVSYRDQPVGAIPVYPETVLMHPMPASSPPRDTIEVVSFATAPAQVVLKAGTQSDTCQVPAGRGICTFPLSLGSISAEMLRDGAVVATARSNADVTDTPYVQDLQYRVVGGLR
jgi:Glycosyl hydrolase family 71